MDKDADNAALDAKTLNGINESFDTASELNIAAGKGRLDVLAFANLIGRRGESRKIFGPIGPIFIQGKTKDGKPATIAVPPFDLEFPYPVYPAPTEAQIKSEILDRYALWTFAEDKSKNIPASVLKPGKIDTIPQAPQTITSVKVVLADGTEKQLSLLEDFSYAVQQDVNTKARRAYLRSIPRSIIKKAAAVTAGSVALSAVTPQPGQPVNPIMWKTYALAFENAVVTAGGMAKAYPSKTHFSAVGEGTSKDAAELKAVQGIAAIFGQDVTSVALAVLDKAKATAMYTTMLSKNYREISALIDEASAKGASFDAFACLDFAVEIAKKNGGYLTRLTVINAEAAKAAENPALSAVEVHKMQTPVRATRLLHVLKKALQRS